MLGLCVNPWKCSHCFSRETENQVTLKWTWSGAYFKSACYTGLQQSGRKWSFTASFHSFSLLLAFTRLSFLILDLWWKLLSPDFTTAASNDTKRSGEGEPKKPENELKEAKTLRKARGMWAIKKNKKPQNLNRSFHQHEQSSQTHGPSWSRQSRWSLESETEDFASGRWG